METKYYKLAAIIAVLVVLTMVIVLAVLWMRKQDVLVKALNKCGWVLYLKEGCRDCEMQLLLLHGLDGDLENMVSYDANGNLLLGDYTNSDYVVPYDSIKGFPFWYNTKTSAGVVGYQNDAALKKMAKC